ncbi:MAG: HAD family hydrolase [Acidimicrobiales bacterium]
MFEGVLLDFYGTVVHEDGHIIAEVCDRILETATEPANAADVGNYWWNVFAAGFTGSHGDRFETQRELEWRSLASTVDRFGASCNPGVLALKLFDQWQSPELFEDGAEFLETVDLPVAVVSNIDRDDIEAAISLRGLQIEHVVTSEDVRSYKPRPELFAAGLAALDLAADRVLHVGDSIASDVVGANRLGIPVAWVNRSGKPQPTDVSIAYTVSRLTDLLPVLLAGR